MVSTLNKTSTQYQGQIKMTELALNSLKHEFQCDRKGRTYISVRGLARLCGVSDMSIRRVLQGDVKGRSEGATQLLSQIAVSHAGKSIEGATIQDTTASDVIEYYALEAGRYCTEQAEQVIMLSTECFKQLGMMAGTEQGRAIALKARAYTTMKYN